MHCSLMTISLVLSSWMVMEHCLGHCVEILVREVLHKFTVDLPKKHDKVTVSQMQKKILQPLATIIF